MKKEYKDEKSNVFMVCVIICIFIVIITFSTLTHIPAGMYENYGATAPELFSMKWFLILLGPVIFCMFLLYFGTAFSKSVSNFKKWKAYLIENGTKYQGYVTGIEAKSYYDSKGRIRTSYRYKVSYVDPNSGDMKSFITPTPCKVNQNINGATCNVFVASRPADFIGFTDRTEDIIRVSGNNIQMTLNPFKLAKIAYHNTAHVGWLGDEIAVNFVFMGENKWFTK